MEELSIVRFSVLRVTLDTSTSVERVGTGLAPLKQQEEKTKLTSFYCYEFDNMTWVNKQHNRFPQQNKCCNHCSFHWTSQTLKRMPVIHALICSLKLRCDEKRKTCMDITQAYPRSPGPNNKIYSEQENCHSKNYENTWWFLKAPLVFCC